MEVKFHYTPPAEVHLLDLGGREDTLAMVTRGYSQVYSNEITAEEVFKFVDDLEKTKLQTPNSFVSMVWLLKNVTRNFEQQLTRYRVGTSFVCESLRFSDKRDAEFYLKAKTANGKEAIEFGCRKAIETYEYALRNGEAVQDARDILPGSICTHLFFACNLQTLSHIYEQRQCCQAQAEEWTAVLSQMREHLDNSAPHIVKFLKAPWENPNCINCGFGASFDRPCTRQNLFDRNLIAAMKKTRLT